MAWECPILQIPGGIAGVDFSSTGGLLGYQSTGQFLNVKLSPGVDNTYIPAGLLDSAIGISQTNPKSGAALAVTVLGISKVMTGASGLTAGQEYGSDANGLAITKVSNQTGGALDQYVLGQCVEAGAAGTLATVTVGLARYKVY